MRRWWQWRTRWVRWLLLAGLALAPRGSEPSLWRAVPDGALVALDGDTLRLPDGRRVRLPSIDTPETGRPWAEQARVFSAAFVDDAAWQLVPEKPGLDRYGRLLADVQVAGASLSAGLVEAGLAWLYDSRDTELLRLQALAVDERRGLFGALERAPVGPWRRARQRFHHISCRQAGKHPELLPLSWNPGGLFKDGLSPCRRCLPWPPAAADA